MQEDVRRARGIEKIKEVLGQTPEDVERSIGQISPRLASYVLETIYGDIYQNPVLDSKIRQIVTVASLATLGTAPKQLRTHILGARRCGLSREEIVEVMVQLVPFVGLPSALNALAVCQEVFEQEAR